MYKSLPAFAKNTSFSFSAVRSARELHLAMLEPVDSTFCVLRRKMGRISIMTCFFPKRSLFRSTPGNCMVLFPAMGSPVRNEVERGCMECVCFVLFDRTFKTDRIQGFSFDHLWRLACFMTLIFTYRPCISDLAISSITFGSRDNQPYKSFRFLAHTDYRHGPFTFSDPTSRTAPYQTETLDFLHFRLRDSEYVDSRFSALFNGPLHRA